jgi:hypothetical protein
MNSLREDEAMESRGVDPFLNEDAFLKEKVFGPVAKRVMDRADSLLRIARFPLTGIEGWLKVEAVRALGDLVQKLQNRGPDLGLVGDRFIELKGATDCNPSWILGGLKYQTDYPRLACLFIGSGSNIPACVERLKQDSRVVAYETFSIGTDNWIVGLIVPMRV